MIIGIIGFILSIIGIIGYYNNTIILLYIGGIFSLIEIIIGYITGESKSIISPIIFGLIGMLLMEQPIDGLMLGICIENIFLFLIGILMIILIQKNMEGKKAMKKSKKKLIIGIVLVVINLSGILDNYSSCLLSDVPYCSIFHLEYGILYTLGYSSLLIIGSILIILYFLDGKIENKPKKEKTIIPSNENFQDKFTSLKQLKELLDENIITKEKFEKEKKKILNNQENK